MSRRPSWASSPRMGWAGIAFTVLLLTSSAMVTLPTGAMDGAQISAFYAAHRELIVVQQVLGALALVPFLAFVVALGAQRGEQPGVRSWLIVSGFLLAAIELATNILAIALTAFAPPSETAHALTVAEDVADALLFVAIGGFVFAASLHDVWWVRALGLGVGVLALSLVVGRFAGVSTLEAVAPLVFIGFVVLLSIRMLRGARSDL
jgi:hypothetical protein